MPLLAWYASAFFATLRGSRAKNVVQPGLDQLSTYGILGQMTQEEADKLIREAEAAALIVGTQIRKDPVKEPAPATAEQPAAASKAAKPKAEKPVEASTTDAAPAKAAAKKAAPKAAAKTEKK